MMIWGKWESKEVCGCWAGCPCFRRKSQVFRIFWGINKEHGELDLWLACRR